MVDFNPKVHWKELLSKAKKSNNAKTIIENFISLSALQLFNILLPLITLPYILRVLGYDKYGVIVFAASLITYFVSITDFSFRITATRDVAINRNSRKKINLIYSKVIIIRTLFMIISLLLIFLIVLLYKPFRDNLLIYGLSTLSLVGYVLFPEWFFQGIEKMKYITFLNLGIKVFFTIAVFLFIHKQEDYWIYPLLQGLGFIGSGLVGQYILVKKYKLKLLPIKRRYLLQTIKKNTPIFVNQFIPTLYNNTSTFLLGLLTTESIVGMYDAIKKIADLGITIINTVSRVFFPYLNRVKQGFHFYKKFLPSIGVILSIGMIVSYKLIFFYLNIAPDNNIAFITLLLLACSVFFISLYDTFGLNYFVIRRKDKLVMKYTIYATIIGFLLAYPMIYYLNIIGAAIILLISRGIMGISLTYKYIENEKNI